MRPDFIEQGQVLLEGLNSGGTRREIAESCIGIVFLETFHLPVPEDLKKAAKATKLYPKLIQRIFLHLDLSAFVKELEQVNREFLNQFSDMPSTFCVANRQKFLTVRPSTKLAPGVLTIALGS